MADEYNILCTMYLYVDMCLIIYWVGEAKEGCVSISTFSIAIIWLIIQTISWKSTLASNPIHWTAVYEKIVFIGFGLGVVNYNNQWKRCTWQND